MRSASETDSLEDAMIGRPRAAESNARRREFIRLIVMGVDFDVAARDAQIKPERALKLLSHPDIRPLIVTRAA